MACRTQQPDKLDMAASGGSGRGLWLERPAGSLSAAVSDLPPLVTAQLRLSGLRLTDAPDPPPPGQRGGRGASTVKADPAVSLHPNTADSQTLFAFSGTFFEKSLEK